MTPSLRCRAAFELPGREAPDGDVELVEAGVAAGAGELDLKLQLVLRHGLVAHRARGADTWASPRTIRTTGGELAALDYGFQLG